MDLQLFRGQRGHGFYTVVLGGRAGRPDRVSQSPLYKKKYALRVIGPGMVTGTYEVVCDAVPTPHLTAAESHRPVGRSTDRSVSVEESIE